MKKNVWIKLIAIVLCFFAISSIEDVSAESCSTKELNNLKQLAHNIKLSYDLYDDTYNENHTYYFNVFITNLNEKLYIRDYSGAYKEYSGEKEAKFSLLREGRTYSFFIYSSDKTSCADTLLVTKKITLPYYNDYSQRKECNDYNDFELCQAYYSGYIESEDYFLEQLEKYKKELNIPSNKQGEERNLFGEVIKLYSDNWKITVPCTLLIALFCVLLIVKLIKKKKRAKIKI